MIAFLFPGQGSQTVGMGKDFYEAFPEARETFEEADDLLSYRLTDILFRGPQEVLTQTKHSQLAIFVNSLAILRTLQRQIKGLVPSACAGLSLGEYTALCASGRIEMKEALQLVRVRAELMNEACEKVPGTMAAVLGLDAAEVEGALKGIQGVWIANYNCPGQIVISGTKEGVEAGSIALKAKGAKRVLPLTVHGAFHSGLMQSAQDGLAPYIANAKLTDSPIDFAMNVPGDFVQSLDEIRRNLTQQVTQSVRWDQGIVAMEKRGVDLYLEIGPGPLVGLNKKIGVRAATLSLEKVADLDKVAKQIYSHRPETLILDSARQSPIEAQRSERGSPFPIGKGDEAAETREGPGDLRSAEQVSASELARRDRLGEVAASPKSKFQADGSKGSTCSC